MIRESHHAEGVTFYSESVQELAKMISQEETRMEFLEASEQCEYIPAIGIKEFALVMYKDGRLEGLQVSNHEVVKKFFEDDPKRPGRPRIGNTQTIKLTLPHDVWVYLDFMISEGEAKSYSEAIRKMMLKSDEVKEWLKEVYSV